MPFSEGDIARRREALAKREATLTLARLKVEAMQREHQETREMLACTYPNIPPGDAFSLWSTAQALTCRLIELYVLGYDKLEAEQDDWLSLFFRQQSPYAGVTEIDKGYAAVLTQMARQYNDISQTFSVRALGRGELNQQYHGPRARVTATAPVPN